MVKNGFASHGMARHGIVVQVGRYCTVGTGAGTGGFRYRGVTSMDVVRPMYIGKFVGIYVVVLCGGMEAKERNSNRISKEKGNKMDA